METIFLNISAGSGPEECAHAAALTLLVLQKEIKDKQDLTIRIIETEQSRIKGNFRSVLISIEGEKAKSFADSWTGIIQWIWHSTYRPHHKRKNWFVSVKPFSEQEPAAEARMGRGSPPESGELFSLSDVRFETARAGGPGGQHVNKTETAFKAVHIPTGKSAIARDERSQLMNKKLALARLLFLLQKEQTDREAEARSELRHSHWELERGNPVRVYDGETLKPVKISFGKKQEKSLKNEKTQ